VKAARFSHSFRSLASLALLFPVLAACGGRGSPGETHGDAHERSEGPHDEIHDAREGDGLLRLSLQAIEESGLEISQARLRPLAPQIETTGQVDYDQDRMAHVSPRIPGRVRWVPAKLGDRVTAGEVLAVIDSIELGQTKAAYLAALAREEVARETHERERRLFADRISSERELLEARGALVEATVARQTVEETLRLYGLSGDEIASLALGGSGASQLTVRAPFAGRVVEKHATLGELVTPEESLFTLADLSRVWIWIDVYERDLAAVHLGDGVEVRVEARPGERFTGKVTYLGPEVSVETRTIRARIDAANPRGLLRPGMFARVRLTDPHAETAVSALTVPESALQSQDGETVVFVPHDSPDLGEILFERRRVEIGRRQEGFVEIVSGLEEGERVVSAGAFVLKSELSRDHLGGGHTH